MSGLPSTYQQVLKNMNQIAADHAILSDPTDGLVAVAAKVNSPTIGIDKINSRLNNSTTGLEVIAGKVNNATTGIAALNTNLNNTKNRVSALENDVDVLQAYTHFPEGLKIDSTGTIKDANNNVVTPPDISYDTIVDLVEELRDRFIDLPAGGGSAIQTTDDGITKVMGVHVNTYNNTSIGAPSSYKYGVTYEIKKIASVIPSDIYQNRIEFTGETYCLIATYTVDSKLHNESAVSTFNTFNPFQIMVCPKSGNYFKRYADTLTGTWGPWTSAIRTMIEMAEVSATEPTTQLAGEFWYEILG